MFRLELRDATDPPADLPQQPMLLWTDPPYTTGKTQSQGGNSYHDPATNTVTEALTAWADILHPDATIAVCIDYRQAHHITRALTEHGWQYRGEIIWEFHLGRPRTSWWPVRHNNVLTFTQPGRGIFHTEHVPTVPRIANSPGYPDTKPAGSVWNITMSNSDSQRVGYPNQKPLQLIEPFIQCHTNPGDLVVDPYMGSATTGHAALKHGRPFYGADTNPQAIQVATQRLNKLANTIATPQLLH